MLSIGLASPDNLQGFWQQRAKAHFDHLVIAPTAPVVASAVVHADPWIIAEAVTAHDFPQRFRKGKGSPCCQDHADRSADDGLHVQNPVMSQPMGLW
jgi:hypothetical protein